jgi:hypothetical protein
MLQTIITSAKFTTAEFTIIKLNPMVCHFFIVFKGIRFHKFFNIFFLISGLVLWVLPRMIGDGDCGEIGGMNIGRGNRSTRRKPTSAPLCPPQIPHG